MFLRQLQDQKKLIYQFNGISFTPIAKDPPVVPISAPAEISPVSCSSTVILIILRLFLDP